MNYIYNNTRVEIEDPQERMKDLRVGEEITVHLSMLEDGNFHIRVPEKKEPVDTSNKPKAVNVYKDKELNVTGSITVKEQLKVGIQLDAKKALEVGQERIKDSLLKGLEKTYEACKNLVA